MKADFPEIARKALEFVKGNLSDDLSLARIARECAISVPWLKVVFKKATGGSVWSYVQQLRLEKAKELLRQTNLNITDVALESGFGSYTNFSIAFRKHNKMNAAQYRDFVRATKDSPALDLPQQPFEGASVFFADSFLPGKQISQWQKSIGKWTQEMEGLRGESDGGALARLEISLPENFRLRFEVMFPHARPSDLQVFLMDSQAREAYCGFYLGEYGNTINRMTHHAIGIGFSAKERLRSNAWQVVELELKEDTINLRLNGKAAFRVRDPFPPPYAKRSRFVFGFHANTAIFRNFEIHDLGFVPFVQQIRQGDSLYNSEIYDRAQEFYARQLASPSGAANLMELRYKMGMCFLRRNGFEQARDWLAKIATPPEKDEWARYAKAALLETDWLQGDWRRFLGRLKEFLPNPALRDHIRGLSARTCNDLRDRGFFDQVIQLNESLLAHEDEDGIPKLNLQIAWADSLRQMNRFDDAKKAFEAALKLDTPGSLSLFIRLQYADILSHLGMFTESENQLQIVEKATGNNDILFQVGIDRAFNLRGQEQPGDAASLIDSLCAKFPEIKAKQTWAQVQRMLILGMTGAFKHAEKPLGSESEFRTWSDRAPDLYALPLFEKNFALAAEILAAAALKGLGPLHCVAFWTIASGICFELAGEEDEARRMWEDAEKRFLPERCNFYGPLAQAFLEDKNDLLETMPYPNQRRAEMFYLAGLLYERRGKADRAAALFALSAAEDRTLLWPSYLAKRKLS